MALSDDYHEKHEHEPKPRDDAAFVGLAANGRNSAEAEGVRESGEAGRRPDMNILRRMFLKVLSAPMPDVKQRYPLIRQFQKMTGRRMTEEVKRRYDLFDREILSSDGRHKIPVRVFLPQLRSDERCVIYFHGGGWVTGDIDYYSPACFRLADALGMILFSVEYRLAPEHPYPSGFDDCFRVASLLLEQPEIAGLHEAAQIILAGDSAGGELAAAVSLRLAHEGLPLAGAQMLFYPSAWWDHSEESSPFESIRENSEGYGLSSKDVRDYLSLYEADAEKRKTPYIAPLLAENLAGQPDTLLITAAFDPLRDEGEAYGAKLAEFAVRSCVHRIDKAIHGFMTYPQFSPSLREALRVCRAFLGLEGMEAAKARHIQSHLAEINKQRRRRPSWQEGS